MSPAPSTPEGWYYEAPDPSVGIFAGEWVHEDCPLESPEVNEEVVGTDREGDTITTTYRISCGCGADMSVQDYDYDPEEPYEEVNPDLEGHCAGCGKRLPEGQKVYCDLGCKLRDKHEM